MNDQRTLIHNTTGQKASGYTLELHNFVSGNTMNDYDNNTYIGKYTDNGDGTYSIDVDVTNDIVWILKNSSGTVIKKRPARDDIGELLIGDDTPLLP